MAQKMGSVPQIRKDKTTADASSPKQRGPSSKAQNVGETNSPKESTSGSPRPRLTDESYLKSALILIFAVVLHYLVIVSIEHTPFVRSLSETVSGFLWACPNWVCYAPASIYFVVVIWHLYFRSVESKLAASKKGGPGSLTNDLLIGWNFALSSMSMLMMVGFVREVIFTLRKHGFSSWVCDGGIVWHSSPDLILWSHLFCLSKFPELLDTAFLVWRGKHVIFLHWYHHITVMLYCWFVTQVEYPATQFASMNAFVHSLMYYYYARRAQGVNPSFGRALTLIQLMQMVAGVLFSAMFWVMNTRSPSCDGGKTVRERGLLFTGFAVTGGMYLSYFVLFLIFYINRWMHPKKGSHDD